MPPKYASTYMILLFAILSQIRRFDWILLSHPGRGRTQAKGLRESETLIFLVLKRKSSPSLEVTSNRQK